MTANQPAQEKARRNVEQLLAWKRGQQVAAAAGPGGVVRRMGVVGAGLMGTSIAAASVRHGLPTVISDADPAAVAAAPGRIAAELNDPLSPAEADRAVSGLVTATSELAALADCDLVLESVVEELAAKQRLLQKLEAIVASDAMLATNTSTIPIGRLSPTLRRPERFCGIHFCHPVRERPVVEIVRGPATADQTVADAICYADKIRTLAIVVGDGPGFLINRMLVPYLNEAMELLLDGVPIGAIERAALEFGMAMGPLELLDAIGLDTALRGGLVLREAFPERVVASPLPIALIKAGRLGRKSGAGFFAYPGAGRAMMPDPAIEAIIAKWSRPGSPPPPDGLLDRLLLPMLVEATRIIEEGLVADPRDVDLAVLLGLGFPQSQGGLLYWADALGARHVAHALAVLAPLGKRFEPTTLLRELAAGGARFY